LDWDQVVYTRVGYIKVTMHYTNTALIAQMRGGRPVDT